MPAATKAEDILALEPDGIFLSNGPGDPAATGSYMVGEIEKLIDADLPIPFGISPETFARLLLFGTPGLVSPLHVTCFLVYFLVAYFVNAATMASIGSAVNDMHDAPWPTPHTLVGIAADVTSDVD